VNIYTVYIKEASKFLNKKCTKMSAPSGKVDFKQFGTTKKIESPLAKYNSAGQLTCIICDQVVKSELVWNAHVNSKTHLENKNKLKSKLTGGGGESTAAATPSTPAAAATSNSSSETNGGGAAKQPPIQDSFKRPAVPPPSTNRELLKRLIDEAEEKKVDDNEEEEDEDKSSQAKRKKMENLVNAADSIDLNKKQSEEEEKSGGEKMDTTTSSSALPAGFFDDPDEDARVRGTSTRSQTLEAEYEEFKKAMQTEEFRSDLIVERDDTLRDVDRDIVEADELIERWTRIEQLHQKREALKASKAAKNGADKNDDDDEDDEDVDLDSAMGLALRAKNIC
jgi:zinc finger protein 830